DRSAAYKQLDESGSLPKRNLYLLVRMPFQSLETKRSGFFKNGPTLSEADLAREVARFNKLGEDLTPGLSSVGIRSHRLSELDTLTLIYNQGTPDRPIEG